MHKAMTVTLTLPQQHQQTTKLRFSTPNRACSVCQTLPLFPYLDANYVTRSTTNAICLPQENCGRQIALVIGNHRLVFYLCVRPKSVFDGYVNEREVSSEQPRPS